RHENPRGTALDEIAELEARVVVLAGRDGDLDRARDLGARRDVVGEYRLLVPHEVELFERLRLAYVREHVQALVHIHHHAYAVAQRATHRRDAFRVLARVGMVDLHLVVLAALRGVPFRFGDQFLFAVLRPAAAAVRGNAVGHRAPELVERLPRDFPRDVPQTDVERRERVGDDALL